MAGHCFSLRVEYRTGLSALIAATSEDGITNWEIDPERGLHPLDGSFEEHWGIEDPRITQVGDEYFVVYVGYSAAGPLVLLATTRNFVDWERRGVLMSPEDKDAALFPITLEDGGRSSTVPRPQWRASAPTCGCPSAPTCAIGETPGSCSPRRGGWWDANKVGLGPPPLLTKDGWLVAYHGGDRHCMRGRSTRLGLALLDRDDPSKVLRTGKRVGLRAPRRL